MNVRIFVLGIISLYLSSIFAVQAATEAPFLIEKKVFKKSVKAVAVSPLEVPDMIQLSDEMRAYIEAEASKALAKTKIKSVGIPAYAEVQTLFANQIGGLRNTEGKIDSQRKSVVDDHTKRELRMRHSVDGFAQISLRVVNAPFSDDRAEWDGIKRKVKSSGDGFTLLTGKKNYQGTIAATSFQLAIYNRNDKLLFVQRGGIDVMQERKGENLILRSDDFVNDPKRLKKAVKMAFKSL